MNLHPLDPSVKCHYCGRGDLVFVRTRNNGHVYRCTAEIPFKGYTVHSRRGRICGIGADTTFGMPSIWVECACRDPAKGT